MGKGKTVSFPNVTVVKESPKALLVIIDDAEHWIPKSQIDEDSEVWNEKTSGGTLVISEWIATEKKLI